MPKNDGVSVQRVQVILIVHEDRTAARFFTFEASTQVMLVVASLYHRVIYFGAGIYSQPAVSLF